MKTRDELTICGIECDRCAIYRSTVLNETLSDETYQTWQNDFKKFWKIELTGPEQLRCRGCHSEEKDEFYGFKLCPIRKCCKTRNLSSCGLCPEFKTCKQHDIAEGRENLERTANMEKRQ
jgi:hypothetical protein